jgi:hypothetical protein
MAVVTGRNDVAVAPGSYGRDGGMGTSWYSDRTAGLIGILLSQAAWTSPSPPDVCREFWKATYRAIVD